MPVLELLAPAKNVLMAKTAVNHGADAVYMGGTAFGARQNACNSLSDIQQAVQYAHQYHAKVYVTLNTILYDNELEQARKMAFDLYDIGADALIIQDMSLLSMSLPPIALHASAQCGRAENKTLSAVGAQQGDIGARIVIGTNTFHSSGMRHGFGMFCAWSLVRML